MSYNKHSSSMLKGTQNKYLNENMIKNCNKINIKYFSDINKSILYNLCVERVANLYKTVSKWW